MQTNQWIVPDASSFREEGGLESKIASIVRAIISNLAYDLLLGAVL